MDLLRNPAVALPIAVFAIALVSFFDYLTGREIALSFFYLPSVMLATRAAGRVGGMAIAILAAGAFAIADLLVGVAVEPWTSFWNFSIRAATLITVALLVDQLAVALKHERELSGTDALTKLLNSRRFREQAERELSRAGRTGRPLTLIFMDLDNFKNVNDDLGHAKGDEVLSLVGELLTASTRAIDVVGRLGGDEFALLLPETDARAADVVVGRMRSGLARVLEEADMPESVSFSIGMVTTDLPQDSLDALILIADQLMYSAKRAGKNQVKAKDLMRARSEPVRPSGDAAS